MGTKGRSSPRIVCCAIPIARAAEKILVVTSRKRPESWVLPKGGWELSDVQLEAAASREALEEGPTYSFLRSSPPNTSLPLRVKLSIILPIHAFQTAGVRGTITRFVTTIPTPSTTYHFYELDVAGLDQDWMESGERKREWVDYAEAVRRLEWKTELAQGLKLSSLAPVRTR